MKILFTRILPSSLIAILFLSAAFIGGVTKTDAGTGLTIQPVKISQTINPGDEIQGKIYLANASEDDVIVTLKVEDFIPSAGTSNIQFIGRAPGLTTVRDWVSVDEKTEFVFKKGEDKTIPYTIRVPKDAEPGGHFGVVFFKAVKKSDSEQQLKVGTQVGMLIFVTVPGNHLQKGEVKAFTAPKFLTSGPVPFILTFENQGTVHFEPKGSITIKNIFGKTVASVPIEGQVVLPTGIKDLHVQWLRTLLFGRYTADVALYDGDGALMSAESLKFWVLPIGYIIGVLVAFILLFLFFRFLSKKLSFSISVKK